MSRSQRRGQRRRPGRGGLYWFRGFLLCLGGIGGFWGAYSLGAQWQLALMAAAIGIVVTAIVTDRSLW